MSLTHERSIALGFTPTDAVNDLAADRVVVISTSQLKVFKISDGTQVGSTASLGITGHTVTMLNAASALVCSFSQSSADLVEIPNGFRQTYTGGGFIGVAKAQQVTALDGVGYATSFTLGRLVRFDPTTFTYTETALIPAIGNSTATVITTIPGRLLVGTNRGELVELDQNLNCTASMSIVVGTSPDSFQHTTAGVSFLSPGTLSFLSYSDPFVIVSSAQGWLIKIHWPSKTVVDATMINGSGNLGVVLGPAASGTVITGHNQNISANVVAEIDVRPYPMELRDMVFTTSSGAITASGISGGRAWAAITSLNQLLVFTVVPQERTTKLAAIADPGYVPGRVIRLKDSGIGTAVVELDTAIGASPEALPVSTGANIIDIALYGEGLDEKASVSEYST